MKIKYIDLRLTSSTYFSDKKIVFNIYYDWTEFSIFRSHRDLKINNTLKKESLIVNNFFSIN